MSLAANRFRRLLSVAVAVAALAIGAGTITDPAIGHAERVWDIENFDDCMSSAAPPQMNMSLNEQKDMHRACCESTGGVFTDDGYLGKCTAPPATGTRHIPGNIRIPTGVITAPDGWRLFAVAS